MPPASTTLPPAPTQPRNAGLRRATVANNVDPLGQGRLLVSFADSTAKQWAVPCVPFTGPQLGFFALPPVNAQVWIQFEDGDPTKPVWTGGCWRAGELPAAPATADVVVLSTPAGQIQLDATTHQVTIRTSSRSMPSKIVLGEQGIRLTCGPASLTLGPTGIELRNGAASVVLSPVAVSINNGALEVI